jgi:hypothetical protein
MLNGFNIHQMLGIPGVILTQINPLFGHKPTPVKVRILIDNRIRIREKVGLALYLVGKSPLDGIQLLDLQIRQKPNVEHDAMADPPFNISVAFNQSIVTIDEPGKGIFPAERFEIHLPQITGKQPYSPKASESLQTAFRKTRSLFSEGYEFTTN